MKIYLDPNREGCTVWFDNGNIQTLKGDVRDICGKIKDFSVISIFDPIEMKSHKRQIVKIYLDIAGIGVLYGVELKSIGVEFEKCKYKKLIQ